VDPNTGKYKEIAMTMNSCFDLPEPLGAEVR
jgi:hypothetical protein